MSSRLVMEFDSDTDMTYFGHLLLLEVQLPICISETGIALWMYANYLTRVDARAEGPQHPKHRKHGTVRHYRCKCNRQVEAP